MINMKEFITFANELADASGEIARQYYRTPFDVVTKDDASPVTIADRAIEQRVREIIEQTRPQDGILGEEFGEKKGTSGFTWVLDPIDGTKSFVIGRPTFGTLIALCEGIIPVLGVIDQPILAERWVGAQGVSTFNGNTISTRSCDLLRNACVTSTSPSQIPDLWRALYAQTKMVAWGGDCFSYGLMANGTIDAIFERGLNTYDYAALVPIITGAGGMICDFAGEPLTLESDGSVLAVGDGAIQAEALALIHSACK